MSQKSGKKAKRRSEEEQEITKKDSIIEKGQRRESESADESGPPKESELNGRDDDSIASNTRSHFSPLQNKKDTSADFEVADVIEGDPKQEETSAKNDVVELKKNEIDENQPVVEKHEEVKIVEFETSVVEECVVIPKKIEGAVNRELNESVDPPANGEHEKLESSETTKNTESESAELEPLILEGEDPDPELQFDENSDVESRKSSPIIRCRTRRSLTRNIPTPKTPKSFLDGNGEDVQGVDKQLGFASSEDEPCNIEIKEISGGVSKLCDSFESIGNISTKAVAGSDVTRNMDVNCSAFQEYEPSPFLSVSRDHSVGDALRQLSSRRSIRPVKDYQRLILQVSQEKKSRKRPAAALAPPPPLPPPAHGRPSVERISGLKRKSHSQTPDHMKRFKPDSPGLLSYISSPIQSIKNHFVKSEISSSTPKLTGYKNKTTFDNSDVSKIYLDLTPVDNTEKRWCSIM